MQWPRLLAYITGRIDKELLVRNEYLAAENRIASQDQRPAASKPEKVTLSQAKPSWT